MGLLVIRTQRLVLRPWTHEDVDALHALWKAPEVRRYLWDDVAITREMAERVVDSQIATANRHGIGYWALHLPTSVAPAEAPLDLVPSAEVPLAEVPLAEVPMIGFSGFRFIDEGPDIELMYGLQAEHWGRGYATEACVAAIEYLWRSTGFQQVYARTDPPNAASVRVMKRLGMAHQSTTPSTITYVLRRPA